MNTTLYGFYLSIYIHLYTYIHLGFSTYIFLNSVEDMSNLYSDSLSP